MKKRLLSTLLTLCAAFLFFPVTVSAAEASGSCGDNITWSYGGGVLSIQGVGRMEDYDLEKGVKAPWNDYLLQIRTIEIGDGVTGIGKEAFLLCEYLFSVTIPDSVSTIGDGAFAFCFALAGVTIPDGVTAIGNDAFSNCSALTGVTIPNSVASIGYDAFSGCGSLTSVVIPDRVTAIERYTFFRCGELASVTIPGGVTSIGEGAFLECGSLKDVYYGGSESQWKQISIASDYDGNAPLLDAVIHCSGAGPGVPAAKAVLSPQMLAVDGKLIDCEKYNIDGSNYFKLRDLAQLLNGTGSQFGVGFDEAASTVSIAAGEAYTSTGTELKIGVDNSSTAGPSSQTILIDGVRHSELTVYNIGGSNFFQLRELGDVLGFAVDYDASTNTAIVRSVPK